MREMDGQIKRDSRFFASPPSRLDLHHGAEIRRAPAPVGLLDDPKIAIPTVSFLCSSPLFSKSHNNQDFDKVKYRGALPLPSEADCSRSSPVETLQGDSRLLTVQPVEMLRGSSCRIRHSRGKLAVCSQGARLHSLGAGASVRTSARNLANLPNAETSGEVC